MNKTIKQEEYTKLIRKHVGDNGHVFFYWKGRIALYALLKSMGIGKGDEVILPAFSCVVVPNAILYIGATPVYVDIEPDSYNASFKNIEAKVSPKTKLIICQNTFGLSVDVDAITDYAQRKGIYTIEDCTHGFGGSYNNKPNGSWCDAAFYSTQWNKPFSTGIGGISLLNNLKLQDKLEAINAGLIKPSFTEVQMLSALIFIRKNLVSTSNYWLLLKLYRWLSKYKLVIGSSGGDEITGTAIPSGYFKAASNAQFREGIKNIKQLPEILERRKVNSKIYTDFLKLHNKTYVNEKWHNNHSFLKYPILVKNRHDFILKAEAAEIELGEWFCSPLHPVPETELYKWGMNISEFPVALNMSRHILNLPTDTMNVEKVIAFITQNIDLIL